MELLVERLERRSLELNRWLELERGEPAEVRIVRDDTLDARLPDYDDSQAPPLRPRAALAPQHCHLAPARAWPPRWTCWNGTRGTLGCHRTAAWR
jgi:hypothetical protein